MKSRAVSGYFKNVLNSASCGVDVGDFFMAVRHLINMMTRLYLP